MPWINMTVREGALTTEQRHEVMARLTEALMFWEKVPELPEARKIMKGWVYEVAADADYNGGSPDHQKPWYQIEVCIVTGRLDLLDKRGIIRDFTEIIMRIEDCERTPENLRRVWVTIRELDRDDWVSAATPTGYATTTPPWMISAEPSLGVEELWSRARAAGYLCLPARREDATPLRPRATRGAEG